MTVCAVKGGIQVFENGEKSALVKVGFSPYLVRVVPSDPWKAIISGEGKTEAWDLKDGQKMFDIGAQSSALDFQPLDSGMIALA